MNAADHFNLQNRSVRQVLNRQRAIDRKHRRAWRRYLKTDSLCSLDTARHHGEKSHGITQGLVIILRERNFWSDQYHRSLGLMEG